MLDPNLPSSANEAFDGLGQHAQNEVRSVYYSEAKKTSLAYLFLLLSIFFVGGTIPLHCFYLKRMFQAIFRTVVPLVLAVGVFALIVVFLMHFEGKGIMDLLDGGLAYFVWMAVLGGTAIPFVVWTIVDLFLVPMYVRSANAKTADLLLQAKTENTEHSKEQAPPPKE